MKQLPREQIESRKAKAVRFVRDVVGDPGRADQIADESIESYARRRDFEIVSNPKGRFTMAAPRKTIQDYKDEIADLKDENADLQQENEDLAADLDAIQDILQPEEDEDADEDQD